MHFCMRSGYSYSNMYVILNIPNSSVTCDWSSPFQTWHYIWPQLCFTCTLITTKCYYQFMWWFLAKWLCQISPQPVIDTLSGHMCIKSCVYKTVIANLVMYRYVTENTPTSNMLYSTNINGKVSIFWVNICKPMRACTHTCTHTHTQTRTHKHTHIIIIIHT